MSDPGMRIESLDPMVTYLMRAEGLTLFAASERVSRWTPTQYVTMFRLVSA